MPRARLATLPRLAYAGLIAALFLQSLLASRAKSPIFDEPPHIAAGMSYLATGRIQANPQHPPLLKELSAAGLWLGGVRWPQTRETEALRNGTEGVEWTIGNQLIADYGPDRTLFWARLPLILLSILLSVTLFLWGRELLGAPAAFCALLLFVFDPTVVSHAGFVATDVGFACFAMLLLAAVWKYGQRPSATRALACGAALGAALAAKYSAIFLIPVTALLVWLSARRFATLHPQGAGRNDLCPCGSGLKFKRCHGSLLEPSFRWNEAAGWVGALVVVFGVAGVVVEALYFFPSNPTQYVSGLLKVNADHSANHMAYLAGKLESKFCSYFLVAYLVKEPLASILAAAIGLYAVCRRGGASQHVRTYLLLPPAVLLAAYTVWSNDLGFRYLIPVLPFLHLVGGAGLAFLFTRPGWWGRALGVVLCLWIVMAAAGVFPDGHSYFNEAACLATDPSRVGLDGGSRCGPLWLDDSNVDWGQGLKQLRAWLDQHAPGRKIKLTYFGSFPPSVYGIDYEPVSAADLVRPPAPGLYAISGHMVAGVPPAAAQRMGGGGEWLRTTRPTAVVGHAIYIYDIR